MAIYALEVKHRAKGKGASASAHALYIAREGKYAEKRAEAHAEYLTREGKHTRRAHELEAHWSGNMPAWAGKAGDFWEAADTYERANGRVYTEIVVALPRELSKAERKELVTDFVKGEIGDRFPYTVAVHNPRAMDGGEQPHAHIMFSIRELDGIERGRELYFKRANDKYPEKGGAKKSREWSRDNRENDRINEIRASWESLANRALEKAGHEARIDRRTLEAQGIDREPEPKMGPAVTQRLKRGQATELGEKVIALRSYRRAEEELKALEREAIKEKAKVYNFAEEKSRRERPEAGEIQFSGERRSVPEEEKRKYQRTVDLVLTRHARDDGSTEFRWKRSGKVAFVDRGDKISLYSSTSTAVKAALQVAKEKGWNTVRVTGDEAFRREAWHQGNLMGMEVAGYQATIADRARLEEAKIEREDRRGNRMSDEKEKGMPIRMVPAEHSMRLPASVLVDDVGNKIELKRSEISSLEKEKSPADQDRARALKTEVDSLYKDRHTLKQLGDRPIVVVRTQDGDWQIDPKSLREQAREAEKEREQVKDRSRSR